MPVIQGIEDEVEEGVSNPERLSVCVVRHAERADASVAFDDWCTWDGRSIVLLLFLLFVFNCFLQKKVVVLFS